MARWEGMDQPALAYRRRCSLRRMWGTHRQQRGEDGLASGLQICPSAALKANSERAEEGQVASPLPALVLSQAGVRSADSREPGLSWGKVRAGEDSTGLIEVSGGSETLANGEFVKV